MATQEKTWNVANRMHSQKDSDNPAVNHIITGADEIYDDAKGAKQSDINAQNDAALADRYTKGETYSKEQLDALITTPDVNYVTVATFADLPQTGEADTVYRVSFYDGTQVDASKYALYAWNGATYQLLAVRSAVGEVFDVSEYNSGATYETLTAALNAVPVSVRKGGMSIKFVLSSDNKYVEWRYTSSSITNADISNIGNWIGVDEEPVAESHNLVESKGVRISLDKVRGTFDFSTNPNTYYYTVSGKSNNLYRLRTYPIPVNVGDKFTYRITCISNTYEIAALNNNKELVVSASVIGNNSRNIKNYTVPSGISYVIFTSGSSNTDIHEVYSEEGIISQLNSTKEELQSEIESLNEYVVDKIALTLIRWDDSPELPYGINANSYTTSILDTHKIFPVEGGSILRVKRSTANSYFAFVKSNAPAVPGEIPDLADGEIIRVITSIEQSFTVPSDAKYIVITSTTGGDLKKPLLLTIDRYDLLNSIGISYEKKVDKTPSIYKTIVSSANNPFYDDIKELYIPNKFLSGADKVIFSCTGAVPNTSIHLVSYSGSTVIWQSRTYEFEKVNNKAIKLKCTVAGGSASLNDIVGYVVFSDVEHFSNNPRSLNDNLEITLENNYLVCWPIISYQFAKDNSDEGDIVERLETVEEGLETVEERLTVGLSLPPIIYAVEGDNLQIYHRNVIKAVNYKNYSIIVLCDYGKNFPRYYEFKPTSEHVGQTKTLTYKLFDNNNNLLAERSSILKIVSKPVNSPSTPINILTLGASVTVSHNMAINRELNRRLTSSSGNNTPYNPTGLGLSNINLIGRKENNGIHQEASGGWGWTVFSSNNFKFIRFEVSNVTLLNLGDTYSISGVSISSTYYLTIIEINVTEGSGNILCDVNGGYAYPTGTIPSSGNLNIINGTGDNIISYSSFSNENGNPLWNDSLNRLDFKNYSNLYCSGADISILQSFMGLNDFRTIQSVDTKVENNLKPIIRQYHLDYPNGKVILGACEMFDITGGMGASYGATPTNNWYERAMAFWYYAEKLYELARNEEFADYVIVTGGTLYEFDCENAYPYRNANVNNRIDRTEMVGSNGAHPTEDGVKMFSDAFYRCICSEIL